MTRKEQIRNEALKYVQYTDNILKNAVGQAFTDGAEYADANPIINEELIETAIKRIETGEAKTLSEYSRNAELSKAFDAGQISALKLLIEYINYQKNGLTEK